MSQSCSTGCQCSPYMFLGCKALYGHVGGTAVNLSLGDMTCSGGIQLGQGAAVLKVVDSSPVKVFSVLVEAHWEKEFLEDIVL